MDVRATPAGDIRQALRRGLAHVCHESRAPVLENNPWRSLTRAVGWVLVAVALTMPLLGVALRPLPWPESTHAVVGLVLGLMLLPELVEILLIVGVITIVISRAIPRYPLTRRTVEESTGG